MTNLADLLGKVEKTNRGTKIGTKINRIQCDSDNKEALLAKQLYREKANMLAAVKHNMLRDHLSIRKESKRDIEYIAKHIGRTITDTVELMSIAFCELYNIDLELAPHRLRKVAKQLILEGESDGSI